MRRLRLVLPLAALLAYCGDSGPASPTSVSSVSSTGGATLSGTLVATNGGQALSGLTITVGTSVGQTDSTGRFSFSFPSAPGTLGVSVVGGSIVSRQTRVAVGTSRAVTLDAIAQSGGFDLGFYRQLVRNGLELTDGYRNIDRWEVAPKFYVRTVDEAGQAMPAAITTRVAQGLVEAVTLWTGGKFASKVDLGTDTREGIDGWVTVKFYNPSDATACGRSEVAGTRMWLDYLDSKCKCGGVVAPSVVVHETGHILGFWHVDNPKDVMYRQLTTCDMVPSDREKYHAAIAYSRPIGNADPDTDPTATVLRSREKTVID